MEAKLGQNAGDCGGLFVRELNPNPLANHLGEFKKVRRLALKQGQQFFGVERAIRLTAGEINLPQICSAEWFGTVLES